MGQEIVRQIRLLRENRVFPVGGEQTPLLYGHSPESAFKKVVLPQPLEPTIAIDSPCCKSRLMGLNRDASVSYAGRYAFLRPPFISQNYFIFSSSESGFGLLLTFISIRKIFSHMGNAHTIALKTGLASETRIKKSGSDYAGAISHNFSISCSF